MECKFNHDGICANANSPMYYDHCPVPYVEGICKYEERKVDDQVWRLTPKGCLAAALDNNDLHIANDYFDAVWKDFFALMKKFGYAEDD